jgi:Flp pilus assembly protein TadD
MSWWSRLLGGKSESDLRPQRLDYLTEALALERQGDFDAALTSYRLALRDKPDDHRVLQNMAIAFTKTGRVDEAIRAYRRALELQPRLSGAHYGLAFLLLKRGDDAGAAKHLEEFLAEPPKSAEAERWVRHARQTLDQLRAGPDGAQAMTEYER